MKSLKVVDEKGSYVVNGKSTVGQLLNRFGHQKMKEVFKNYLKTTQSNLISRK